MDKTGFTGIQRWCPELGGELAEAPELRHLKSPAADDENDGVTRIADVRVVDEGGVTALHEAVPRYNGPPLVVRRRVGASPDQD